MTTIAIVAERDGVDISGAFFDVEKHMSSDTPRRIDQLPLVVHLPETLTPQLKEKYERAGKTCPVHHSLKSEIKVEVTFLYDV